MGFRVLGFRVLGLRSLGVSELFVALGRGGQFGFRVFLFPPASLARSHGDLCLLPKQDSVQGYESKQFGGLGFKILYRQHGSFGFRKARALFAEPSMLRC